MFVAILVGAAVRPHVVVAPKAEAIILFECYIYHQYRFNYTKVIGFKKKSQGAIFG